LLPASRPHKDARDSRPGPSAGGARTKTTPHRRDKRKGRDRIRSRGINVFGPLNNGLGMTFSAVASAAHTPYGLCSSSRDSVWPFSH